MDVRRFRLGSRRALIIEFSMGFGTGIYNGQELNPSNPLRLAISPVRQFELAHSYL